MNAVIEAIKKRRSVRAYEAKPIPRDILSAIIEAGNEAPSAMNSQPWRFVVVEDAEAKKSFWELRCRRRKLSPRRGRTSILNGMRRSKNGMQSC